MNNMSNTYQGLEADANAELAKLRDKVETLMSERVTPALASMANKAEDAAHNAREKLRDGTDSFIETVREKPLTSIGLAALAGFVIASLVRR